MSAIKFKPLLAYTVEDTSTLTYPLYASIKLDGIRVCILDGVVYSRSMKPIRSTVVQKLFGKAELNGLDGELLYGDWNAPNVFNITTQAVMATTLKEGFKEKEIRLAVFDYIKPNSSYIARKEIAENITAWHIGQIKFVRQKLIHNEADLLEFENTTLDNGYEGLMVRSIDGRYKQGRSTAKEGIIGKIKRMEISEAIIIGFEERMHNTNEKTTNELGYSERSSAKSGLVGSGTLGSFILKNEDGQVFNCGSGLDDLTRQQIWDNRDSYIGKFLSYKHFPIGQKDLPRFPIYRGLRDADDMP